MHAIDRYVKQVGCWVLPGRRQAVLRRVREDLEEFLGARDDGLAVEARLRAFGRPPVVAARYSGCSDLIPGMLAPAYVTVLVVTLLGLLLANLTLLIPGAMHGEPWPANVGAVLSNAATAIPWAFTVVTLAFMLLGLAVQRTNSP